MSNLALALGWKFNHEPGICTKAGVITVWPTAVLGAEPSGSALQSILDEYTAIASWEESIAATDAQMPRISEDIIDSMDATQKAALPQLVRDNHAAKKTLRGQRPA
jgi:hypothetical protein